MLGSYLFIKIAASHKKGLDTVSELGAGSHNHMITVHDGEYLVDGGHATGMSVGMSLKLANDKIVHHIKFKLILTYYGQKTNF